MACKLYSSDTVKPFDLEVTFKIKDHTVTHILRVEKPILFREFGEAAMRGVYDKMKAFLETALPPADPPAVEAPAEKP